MIFTTPEFCAFFVAFFALWCVLRGDARKLWLLVASYAFYASWSVKFLGLLLLSTCVDFWVGKKLGDTEDPRARKQVLLASIVFNLCLLGFFKYFNFFVDSAHAALTSLGIDTALPVLRVALPVGISFYTFQSLSYTIDVYRKLMPPSRSFLDFATFVACFPQLVAGPIERARRMLPQIEKLGTGALRADHSGWLLIALGAFKKAVIADNVGAYADIAYDDVTAAYPAALWVGTYAFAIQIYCDFSGYSDIAVGLGRLLGLDLMQNFRAPYAARGPSDFWQRWHISLSTWLRDYLYIPLGGNHGGALRTARNLMITMLLGGLWHGAAWNFVLWGCYHGVLLVVGRLPTLAALGRRIDGLGGVVGHALRALQAFVFFHLVCFGWALFRAESLRDCITLTHKLLWWPALHLAAWLPQVRASQEGPYLLIAAALGAGVLVAHHVAPIGSRELVDKLRARPVQLQVGLVATLLYLAAVFAPEKAPPFVYFQF